MGYSECSVGCLELAPRGASQRLARAAHSDGPIIPSRATAPGVRPQAGAPADDECGLFSTPFRHAAPALRQDAPPASDAAASRSGARYPPEVVKPSELPSGVIVHNDDMATGMERKEIDQTPDIFWSREPIIGPKGTKEKPAIIPSFNTSRVVGLETEQGVIWFKLDKGPLHYVAGQYFKLHQIEG
eukprot:CAMPEP_0195565814 /NCGR_PEP_ID=MMETSP0814-20130614/695_1 /TAXON_ID=97485 /ORGANISM="Prymnesium parvum, Strain Texoma1" /LENGTH=185 /DNA_ID=CAMNT_0040700871 /DNA_START=86 /DNA_END=644 /DNA_ORIENTATION=-